MIYLPEEDGLSILRWLQASGKTADMPIILLTAKSTEYDKVLGLDGGACHPGEAAEYHELAPLLGRIRSQNRQQEEFASIIEHMSEDFLVLDTQTNVLSYNSAALRLLGTSPPGDEETSVYALKREGGFRHCVEMALAGAGCSSGFTGWIRDAPTAARGRGYPS